MTVCPLGCLLRTLILVSCRHFVLSVRQSLLSSANILGRCSFVDTIKLSFICVATMTIIRPVLLLSVLLATQLFSGDASSPATRLFHFQCRRNHAHSSKKKSRATGTLLRFQRPTTERVSTWFPSSTPEPEFNHDDVGMTTPCLHIDLKSRDSSSVVEVSTSSSSSCCDSNWWPASPVPKGWRRLRLSRRVGRGSTCYQAVEILLWSGSLMDKNGGGIVQVHSKQSHAEQLYQRRDSYGTGYDVVHNAVYGDGDLYAPSRGRAPSRFGRDQVDDDLRHILRSFRSRWLPKVYCVNPVTVVYDLVDQRGPSTTYTSTAYATSRGHWLRGEERLTVAHRDDGNVDVEILSFSKHGNSVWGRISMAICRTFTRAILRKSNECFAKCRRTTFEQ